MSEIILDRTEDAPRTAPRPLFGRVSAVLRTYYSSPALPPMSVVDQWHRFGTTDGPAYQRPYCVAEDGWQPLDLGWLKDGPVGLVLLSNDEGRVPAGGVAPSPDEVAEREKFVLEVCFGDGRPELHADLLVLPRTTQQLVPVDPSSIRVRSRHKTVRYTITVFPG